MFLLELALETGHLAGQLCNDIVDAVIELVRFIFCAEDHAARFDGNLSLFIFLFLGQHDIGVDIVREIFTKFLYLLFDGVFQMVTDSAVFACDVHSHSVASLLL